MTPSVPQLLSWEGGPLQAAGATLLARAAAVQHVEGDVRSVAAALPAEWSGAAADAAVAHHVRRAGEVEALAEVVHGCGLALQQVGEQVVTARARLQAAVAAAAAAGCTVASDGAVTAPTPPAAPPGLTGPEVMTWQSQAADAEQARASAAQLTDEIRAALELGGAADRAAEAALALLSAPTVSPAPVAETAAGLLAGDTDLLAGALGLAGRALSWLQHTLLGTPLPTDSASLLALLSSARASGQKPYQYADVLRAYWQAKALEHAGIDGAAWRPGLGVDANRATVLKVYEYYRRLYQDDPTLEWAGLANLVGPGFTAAFLDLDGMRDVAREIGKKPGVKFLPHGSDLAEIANLSDDQLRFYETTFLQMQKDIFKDIGAMHEAYLAGPDGMANIQEMADAGLVRSSVVDAWSKIDFGRTLGSPTLLHDGARGLADWEQNHVIAGSWDAMREHEPGGAAVTYLMTVVGRPSVPGAHFPGQVRPLTVSVPISAADDVLLAPVPPAFHVFGHLLTRYHVDMRTPLPDFNVSVREDRWGYFTRDTLPAYTALLDEPGRSQLSAEMARPLEDRIAEQRVWERKDDILDQFSPSHWQVRVR